MSARDWFACVLRAGAWLLRDWAALVSQGSQKSQEQVLGVCVAT